MEGRFDVRFDPDAAPMPGAVELSDALLVALLDLALSADRPTEDPNSAESADNETTPDG